MKESKTFRETLGQILEATQGQQLVTLKKAAEIMGLDPRTLRKELHFRQIGNRLYIAASVLAAWMVKNNE